jgi:predicted permease
MDLLRQFPVPPSASTIDARVLVFALGVSLATGLFFGVLPAMRAARVEPVPGFKDARAAGRSTHRHTRKVLVAVQVSLSLALLVGAALFVRSLREVTAIETGVDLNRLLTARVDLTGAGIDRESFYELALSRLSTLPGIEGAAIVHLEPFSGATSIAWRMPGRTSPEGREVQGAFVNLVGAGYFRTAGTRLLRGREIAQTDRGEPVAVVNEALARLMADDGNAVGACASFGPQVEAGGCTRIVGVVETQRSQYLEPADRPLVFLSWTQAPDAIAFGIPAVLIRTHGEPSAQLTAVRSALQGLRNDLPYVAVRPLAENVRNVLLPFRLGAMLFTVFGMLALAISGVGLYGVLAYFVSERAPEIGVRRSLGAPVHSVVGLVIGQGLIPVGIGLLIGLSVAFGATRYLESLLFGIEPRDPMSFAAAATFLVCVAIVATLLPAWRAARVDPMTALRAE